MSLHESIHKKRPSITIGIVALNREWIIEQMIKSIISQTYPHNMITILMIDGGSEDKTVEKAKKWLEGADFAGTEIIILKSNIPEARNICIEKMKGDALLFWDTDVIMPSFAVDELVKVLEEKSVHIIQAKVLPLVFMSDNDLDAELKKVYNSELEPSDKKEVIDVRVVVMGNTLISDEVLEKISFDNEVTFYEDLDFSLRAGEMGFKIVDVPYIHAYDVNVIKKKHSDIYLDMPWEYAIMGLRKKALVSVKAFDRTMDLKKGWAYFMLNKRFIFYLGYIFMGAISLLGLFYFPLFIVFPIYLGIFLIWQIRKRGKMWLKAVVRSLLVGVPLSFFMLYYVIKFSVNKK